MSEDQLLRRDNSSSGVSFVGVRDRAILRICAAVLGRVNGGRLTLKLPSGTSAVLGNGGDVHASLVLNNFALFGKSLRRGSIGFAESYMSRDVDTGNLGELLRFFVDNKSALTASGRGLFQVRLPDKLFHRRRRNTPTGSRRNIAAHYDLGNSFYAAWLDPSMTYSSALFSAPGMTLAQAQDAKNEAIVAALGLEAGHELLEIGCGWGAFAERAARSGAKVTGITVSNAQLCYGLDRIAAAGLGGEVDLRFQDYRDTTGTFDRIASIEMIEAVGEEHWAQYFQTVAHSLKPGGKAVVQAITIAPDLFDGYRRKVDFIQRYVFPGGMLPTVEIMRAQAAAVGLTFETVREFGADYAQTLRLWRQAFHEQWPQLLTMGYDDRFRRFWEYYLTYCEVGFERGMTNVGHYRLTKPL